mmetsp:Transcript_35116/g.70216  ORF Transcript_35116/g.70216 Transcript_35116/m.70216 type:complete len:255 (+) Transcript_35116:208-972(+)
MTERASSLRTSTRAYGTSTVPAISVRTICTVPSSSPRTVSLTPTPRERGLQRSTSTSTPLVGGNGCVCAATKSCGALWRRWAMTRCSRERSSSSARSCTAMAGERRKSGSSAISPCTRLPAHVLLTGRRGARMMGSRALALVSLSWWSCLIASSLLSWYASGLRSRLTSLSSSLSTSCVKGSSMSIAARHSGQLRPSHAVCAHEITQSRQKACAQPKRSGSQRYPKQIGHWIASSSSCSLSGREHRRLNCIFTS